MSTDYEPYGLEWEAELMKWRKRDVIGLLRQTCIKEAGQPDGQQIKLEIAACAKLLRGYSPEKSEKYYYIIGDVYNRLLQLSSN